MVEAQQVIAFLGRPANVKLVGVHAGGGRGEAVELVFLEGLIGKRFVPGEGTAFLLQCDDPEGSGRGVGTGEKDSVLPMDRGGMTLAGKRPLPDDMPIGQGLEVCRAPGLSRSIGSPKPTPLLGGPQGLKGDHEA